MATAVNKALFYSPGDQGTGGVSFMADNLAPQSGTNQVRKITTTDELADAFRDYYSNQIYRLAYAQQQLDRGIDSEGNVGGYYSRFPSSSRNWAMQKFQSLGSLTPDQINGSNVLDLIGKSGWSGGNTSDLQNWAKGVSAPSGQIYMSPEEAKANGINPTGNSNGYYDANIVKDTAAYKAKIASGELVPTGEKFANGEPMYTSKNKSSGAGAPKLTKTLDFGAHGEEVKDLQKWLISNGYKISEASGYYGNETKAAVTAWQKDIGLDAGAGAGTFGPRSLAAANSGQQATSNSGTQNGADGGIQSNGGAGADGTDEQSSGDSSSTGSSGETSWKPSTGKKIGTWDGTEEMTQQDAFGRVRDTLDLADDLTTISPSFIDKVENNPLLFAFYVGAVQYGGYSMGEIYKDMRRLELIDGGQKQYENMIIMDGTKTREEYAKTNEGRLANNIPEFKSMKLNLDGFDPAILNLPLYDMPDDFFKMLVPVLNPETPEYKAELDKIKSVWDKIEQAKIYAKDEAALAAAQYQYEKFQESINRTYGLQLSSDSTEAWKQIEELGKSHAERGIAGSGLQNEAVDDVLNATRKQGGIRRENKLIEEEAKLAAQTSNYGTPAEIQKLIAEDKAKGLPREQWRATKWGLVPSQKRLDSLDFNLLKQTNPDLTDEEINQYIDSVIDRSGSVPTYRSAQTKTTFDSLEAQKVAWKQKRSDEYTERELLKNEKEYLSWQGHADDPFLVAPEPKDPKTGLETGTTNSANSTQSSTQPTSPTTYAPGQQLPASVSKPIQDSIAAIQKSISGIVAKRTAPAAPTAQQLISSYNPAKPYITSQMTGQTAITTQPTSYKPPATTTTTSASTARTGYQGTSLVDYLKSVGQDSSTTNRAKLATANGITGYSATLGDPTGKLNTQLLTKLRGY